MISKNKIAIISYVLVLTVLFTSCKTIEDVKVDSESVSFIHDEIQPIVKSYSVNGDLSNIENLSQFGGFSEEQIELLSKNNFVVNPTEQEQLFYIYEDNEYKYIPSFITTDSILHIYHIFYDYTLREIEEKVLLNELEALSKGMLEDSIKIYDSLEDEYIKQLQMKNIAYFTIANLCLDNQLPENIPNEAIEIAERELEKINNHSGFEMSALFPYELDYSQFTVRGHYTRSFDFQRFFKALMWYGQAPFPLYFQEPDNRNIDQTLQAILITETINRNENLRNNWEKIYDITDYFVGSSDDLTIYDYADLITTVYGKDIDLNKINNSKKIDKLYKEAKKLPGPKIKAKYTDVTTPTGKQFRFMGQRYVLDAEIIQELVEPIIRPIPSGLDIMATLGSNRAKEIQLSNELNKLWDDYKSNLNELTKRFSNLSNEYWEKNMYTGWIWTIQGLLKEFGEGYPSFMTNEAWDDKDLNTALGSWSELKHDTILYGKSSAAEMGGEDYDFVLSYVEPNIEVYEKLSYMIKMAKENLKERKVLPENIEIAMDRFEWLLEILIDCSMKELNNESLTKEQYDLLAYYGGLLEDLTTSFAGDGLRWFEITSETDKNMAIIADFHTVAPNQLSAGGYMEAGVGSAYEIYVVVPIDGKLYLTRGAVFSYYEFMSNERLTDEGWQDMLENKIAPPMPKWTESFIREGKDSIPSPIYE